VHFKFTLQELILEEYSNSQESSLVDQRLQNLVVDGSDYSSLRSLMRSITSGGGMLFPPVLLYKVSAEDGHEELTRGGVFTNVSTRILREIEAAGHDSKAYPSTSGHQITSIIAP
jgi:hypothetical protein